MSATKLTTETIDNRWTPPGFKVMLGKIAVGKVFYGMNSKTETRPYVATCYLPGLRNEKIRVINEDEGLKFIQAQVDAWLDHVDEARNK